ncbi:MAG: hypothetical protein MJD61_11045 [Proteobacteria bacterium]|nr:hypothetical protein [Pseudomonadota bacterium]
MSSPQPQGASGQSEPPGLPEVHDEAADTPSWVPLAGFTLLAVVSLLAVARFHSGGDPGSNGSGDTQVQAQPSSG